VAVALAIVFAVIVDLLRISSRIRELWRWVKDKYAEGSMAGINQRIAVQEKYRNTLQAYLTSDKTFYLAILRSIVGVLLFMCIAGVILIFGGLKVLELPISLFMALGAIVIAIAAAISTLQLGSYDSSKILELIGTLDTEIMALKEARRKLQNR
jgi:hypothetical protein